MIIKQFIFFLYLSSFVTCHLKFIEDFHDIDLGNTDSESSVFSRLFESLGYKDENDNKKGNNIKKPMPNITDLWHDCLSGKIKNETVKIECEEIQHKANIVKLVRNIGYPISLLCLAIGIFLIILIKRLQRPRNIMHINLFFSFTFRTIMSIISVEYMESPKIQMCKVAEFLFRYSGAVVHMAIFSESFYIVSLLNYPFYTVNFGYKILIGISWLVPLIWMIIWLIAKAAVGSFDTNELCWKPNSVLRLILKIPETFIVLVNLFLAILVVKAINSRLHFSKQKIMRYKRLAKSLLILIPIVEFRFLVYTWLPYIKLSGITMFTLESIESIFYGYQGFMLFLIYSIIQRDLRIECMLFILKLINFFSCCFKIKSSKLIGKVESDLAKAYPFRYRQEIYNTKRNSRVKDFDSKSGDLNTEYNNLT